jgi:5-formaminoimidazole-4-carboxamide-1-beta-D-ribofuranosyl 5'-monophosphate synthetase
VSLTGLVYCGGGPEKSLGYLVSDVEDEKLEFSTRSRRFNTTVQASRLPYRKQREVGLNNVG